jgi:hypothetical protein
MVSAALQDDPTLPNNQTTVTIMADTHSHTPHDANEPAVPSTSDGRVPYSDPLPTAAADASAPDGAPRPTRREQPSGNESDSSETPDDGR